MFIKKFPHMSFRILFSVLLLFALFSILTDASFAQSSETYRIETVDGSVYVGEIISETDEAVTILTESAGEITISRDSIRSIEPLGREAAIRKNWPENHQSSRYLFSPSAIGLNQGHGYYQNTWILFNNVNYGITDHLSIGGGIIPVFLFGSVAVPFWITPKITLPLESESFHLSAGALIGGAIGESETGGVFYGNSTLGDRDRNLTLGLGYAFGAGEIETTPVVSVSGMIRTGRTIYLVSENYFINDSGFNGLASFGVRWAPENFSVDFALLRPLENLDSFIGFPWISLAIPFSI